MFKVVRYRVQAFRLRRAGGLTPQAHQEFREEGRTAALALAETMSRSADGVFVLKIEGEPVQDIWREPVVLVSYGQVPEV